MAIGFKLEDEQWRQWQDNNERLHQSIADLSENLAKWQAQQTAAIETGFSDLVRVLGGTGDEQLQVLIDQLATNLNLSTDEVEAAIKQTQTQKGDESNGS